MIARGGTIAMATAVLVVMALPAPIAAQTLGTFRWQLQPFCNVVTVAITQNGGVFRLEGTEDQCGVGGRPASAIGTAFFNADGSVALGFTIVGAPGGAPTHVMARINIATLGGTWQDSAADTGEFVFTPGPGTGGRPRPPAATNGVDALIVAPPTAPFGDSLPFRRLLWDPVTAAVRAGAVAGAQLDEAQIGAGSVAMGLNTIASAEGSVAMGLATIASGLHSVAMGFGTRAEGENSVALGQLVDASGAASVAMGAFVTAGGSTSVALGRAVSATTSGTFMFGDASAVLSDTVPSAANQFVVRAAGGTRIYSSPTLTAGVELAPGASAWASVSDVNMKEHFRDLDGDDMLMKIARMPIREWSYKTQDAAIRHMGPTAQDFHTAFGLGEDRLKISTIDADGVALRAIQALEARTAALSEENRRLVLANERLQGRLERLERLLDKR